MKLIHTADLHLGSKIESKLLAISSERKSAVLNSFRRLIEYAKEYNISSILLSGDVFDSDNPFKKDKKEFYALIDGNPEITFYYLKGNHDKEENSVEERVNLKEFSSSWESYDLGEDVVVSGLEINQTNYSTFYSSLKLDANKVNIVMLHGQESDSIADGNIKISKLKDKYIDYLALGHIHKFKDGVIDNRGHYVYSGCLEGRGFDEIGEKGFVVIEVINKKVSYKFVHFSSRDILEEEVDISGAKSQADILSFIKEKVSFNKKDIYRITLIGDIDYELEFSEDEIANALSGCAYFINVKNKTLPLIDPNKFLNDLSLRGEFIRLVYADTKLDEINKRKIASLGLKALEGREVSVE